MRPPLIGSKADEDADPLEQRDSLWSHDASHRLVLGVDQEGGASDAEVDERARERWLALDSPEQADRQPVREHRDKEGDRDGSRPGVGLGDAEAGDVGAGNEDFVSQEISP